MRWTWVVAVIAFLAALTLSVWLVLGTSADDTRSSMPGQAGARRAPARAGGALVPHLPLSTSEGARCDLSDAPAMVARARRLAGADAVQRDERLRSVPRSLLDADPSGVRYTFAYEHGEAAGLRLVTVEQGSIGRDLDLRVDDVIGEVDGLGIRSLADVRAAYDAFVTDGVACVRLWRKGRWRVRWYVVEPEAKR